MSSNEKNDNCKRRKELLFQLKCIVDAMDRKNPCDRDGPSSAPPINIGRDVSPQQDSFQRYIPVKDTKSVLLRGSVLYKCECIKRNGLQDRCMMWECMGKPECMTRSYPMCEPGQKVLSKFMEHEDANAALKKLIAADKARESALANYYKLIGSNDDGIERLPSPSSKNPRIQPNKKMFNNQQYQKLQQFYPPKQGIQPLHQGLIYQQPMNHSHAHEQHQHHNHYQFHPQHSGTTKSFMNKQPAYLAHQGHPMNQQYQFQMSPQFVQQYQHSYPPSPYIQNTFLPC